MKNLLLLMVLLMLPPAAAATVELDDFAYGRPLSLTAKGAVYRLELPQDVYVAVTRGDLGDIRIFNSAGTAVPHVLRRPPKLNEELVVHNALPIFPLYRQDASSGSEGLSVRVEKGLDGAIIDVQSEEAKGGTKQELVGYIIDASKHEFRIDELDIAWQSDKADNVATVSLASSHDLTHWTTIVPKATLALMQYSGHRISKTKIPLHAQGGGYLRLSWPSTQNRITVEKITAIRKSKKLEPVRAWATFSSTTAVKAPTRGAQAFEYDSAAHFPADRLRLHFDDRNTLAQARVYSRPDLDADWTFRQKDLIYDLRFEAEARIQNTLAFASTTNRYWRVEIEEGTGDGSADPPKAELGWLPHELVFVARGEGPFMLAYGSARLGEEPHAGRASDLLTAVMGSEEESLIKEAALLPRIVLGGPDLLVPELPPPPWRKWILWGVLILGVGLVAWIALSLARGMNEAAGG